MSPRPRASTFDPLQAALARIEELGIETVYCGGDLVGYGPHPNEVCELIAQLEIPTIYGNYDYAIGRELDDPLAPLDAGGKDVDLPPRREVRYQALVHADRHRRRHAREQVVDRTLLGARTPLADAELIDGAGRQDERHHADQHGHAAAIFPEKLLLVWLNRPGSLQFCHGAFVALAPVGRDD